ncbi:MAG: bifunctional demethylmenaquinone methyltransferase/2-methoxy-6-polyprenyl-1,4-benzoquinol methylase UbiE [Chlorobium sp.]|jgi:demethylmenaquinone methyltransferase/2-methoxy-6-polyprenyl-1,4-benzoquinol methylase|uniref:bifunctional demethylmenaquinone methyltransferase/2-methoxy-6-polyprenyl-1,4-benzoquinol methylase UbiE n=1 Tax=Chlorobium sp. TaxID=1095 RepID=UPI001D96D8B2|nr:bifunctional demethylmenaquinone methyltransferase/2-methoxy-6-polyprenyl-1,4-benzoquinol methylase UbiE [Chlorobium sp.]MBN1279412.1 bifunctional demethylmenaquinone methyltransferase/2-methoxy-6-polyprenyl-1,4-benzoquinol methylase UbiE [Chlorobiaceae bacterium]MCF8217240.1 bifunctional demethylmenaquinone methyltransferase/2-methoxy-6-polyprenyl-1,4-benzoquinol methylase UbiE [Chlorobium sp.]MCF8272098.1 bifunctional demethylmenaquinone methyltransferase/2-methoxy-6-polyprenyl-1,4-benzoqui
MRQPKETAKSLNKTKSRSSIRNMFDEVAPTYDFLNHLLSLGIDNYWRARATAEAKKLLTGISSPGILDVATGTGDLAASMAKISGARVTALDLSPEMLVIARKKYPNITFHEGYAEKLPFETASFDIVSAGFGVRNFENLDQGMQEFCRVLKPGAHAIIIEPMIPRNTLVKKLYLIYFKKVLPKIAALFSKSTFAYDYLPHSVEQFPQAEDFTAVLKKNGFRKADYFPMTFETSILYVASK